MIVTFAIGNSDGRLPQAGWSAFVADVAQLVADVTADQAGQVQFSGFSAPSAPWQNALWAVELGPDAARLREMLRSRLAVLAHRYRQDSIAWWQQDDGAELIPAVGSTVTPQGVRRNPPPCYTA